MNCPKCSNANIPGAKFCMACGCSLVSGPKNSVGKIVAAAAGLIAVTAIIGFAATGVLGARGSAPKNTVLRAEGQTAAPILKATGTATPTILGAEGKAPEKMPADIYAWLEHLRKIEDRKNEITIKQLSELKVFEQMLGTLGAAIGELDPYDQSGESGKDPSSVTKGKFQDLRPAWEKLLDDFRSYPPPAECKPIADDFDRSLNEIPGMVGDMMDVLNQVSSDPAAALEQANKMKNKSYAEIDRYLIRTDERVQAICDKYHTKKWFNIKSDVGGGIFGKM